MPEQSRIDRLLQTLILVAGLVLVALLIYIKVVEIDFYNTTDSGTTDADTALNRAEDAINSVQLILSFLEGASALIAVGLGAAALVGYRSIQEFREEMKKESNLVKDERASLDKELEEIRSLREELKTYEQPLQKLPDELEEIRTIRQEVINEMQLNFSDLLQAYQELNLKNYDVAYRYVTQVLQRSPETVQALYIAGWLELQYIPGKLDDGLTHLKEALHLDQDSPSIMAAYGVGLRRKAVKLSPGSQRTRILTEAQGYLLQALGQNHNLIDLNRESYWGPVAGTSRDLGYIEQAVEYYKKAQRVTPGSSYPIGNLAHLYLQLSKSDPNMLDEALQAFKKTDKQAREEINYTPGDYFPMMDVAMANAMLGHEDKKHFTIATEWLENALHMDATSGMLKVSLGGWERLKENCPPDWKTVYTYLDKAIAIMKDEIAALNGA